MGVTLFYPTALMVLTSLYGLGLVLLLADPRTARGGRPGWGTVAASLVAVLALSIAAALG